MRPVPSPPSSLTVALLATLAACAPGMVEQEAPQGQRAATAAAQSPVPAGYELVYSDEFDGNQLDRTRWYDAHLPHWSTPGSQPRARATVAGGVLTLTARADEQVWSAWDWGSRSAVMSGMYSGPAGSTQGLHQFGSCRQNPSCVVNADYANQNVKLAVARYGYYEIRARGCPTGDCSWWMVGFEEDPQHSGEIDVMEMAPYNQHGSWQGNCMHMGTHRWDDPNLTPESHLYGADCAEFSDRWHTYGLLWTAGGAKFYLDGKLTYELSDVPDYPMVSIFHVGIGLGDPAQVNTLEVDYFRIYQQRRVSGITASLRDGSAGWNEIPAGWGCVASRAVDQDAASYAQAYQHNWDLELDLHRPHAIDRLALRPNWANWATSYRVLVSRDRVHWNAVRSVTGATSAVRTIHFDPPLDPARYLRLDVSAQVGSYAHAWHEVEVYGREVASRGSAATMLNGNIGWGQGPSNAVDGDPNTYAQGDRNNWDLQLDLGRLRNISQVDLRPNWANYPTHYRLQVSEDGSHWSTVRTVSDGSTAPRSFHMLVAGRYVRLDVSAQAGSYPHAIHELTVLAEP